MGRVVLIGDVGGHADQLRWALSEAGIDGDIPPDVTVIQVGDLVDRGPDSSGVLKIVAHYLAEQPRQWIQLTGNHEAQYLPGSAAFWADKLSDEDAGLLRTWWNGRKMHVAAAVQTAEGDDFLVTHAGLTVACWRQLGEPMTAAGAALLLNDRPHEMLFSGLFGMNAGPFWAEAGADLYLPWLEYRDLVPFGQIHGHSSIYRYPTDSWRAAEKVRLRAAVDLERRHVTVRIGGRQFTGIDPKHGRDGAPKWQPLVFTGADVNVP